jgi:hypothetical protein
VAGRDSAALTWDDDIKDDPVNQRIDECNIEYSPISTAGGLTKRSMAGRNVEFAGQYLPLIIRIKNPIRQRNIFSEYFLTICRSDPLARRRPPANSRARPRNSRMIGACRKIFRSCRNHVRLFD